MTCGTGIKVMDTGEEVHFKEVDPMAEEETVLCREGDMMAGRDMTVLLLSEILLLSEDQILEEGQTLEGEKDFKGDMMEAAERDMIDRLSEILLLSEDQTLEEGRIFVAIDHDQGVRIG